MKPEPVSVEIWSDVQCPFCYIGKRQFEEALRRFPPRDQVEVVWRSYQLDPDLEPQAGESIYAYLARRKGMALDQSKAMHDRVAESARAVGLDYQFDKMVVANSHAAHRLIQGAKAQGKGAAMEEILFQAYFTEGRDLGDRRVLVSLGASAGLTLAEAGEAVDDPTGQWRAQVDAEVAEVRDLGSRGVPFFVFQRRFAVTGAQGPDTFLKALEKAVAEPVG